MPDPRVMPDAVLLPDGKVLIVNGGKSGIAGYGNVLGQVGQSNADNPVFTPVLYDPSAPAGKRFDSSLPTSDIPRLYHSVATLTPNGSVMIAGSNPNLDKSNEKYQTEYRVEWLGPPYMSKARPEIVEKPEIIGFGEQVRFGVALPRVASEVEGERSLVRMCVCGTDGCCLSRAHGPRLLKPRVPLERAPRLHGRDDVRRPQESDVHDAPERQGLPARACDDLPDDQRRVERGRMGHGGQREFAADVGVREERMRACVSSASECLGSVVYFPVPLSTEISEVVFILSSVRSTEVRMI